MTIPGTGRGEGHGGRCGVVFWQDPDNYLVVNLFVDDVFDGASISTFYHLGGNEDMYDAVWTLVRGVVHGRALHPAHGLRRRALRGEHQRGARASSGRCATCTPAPLAAHRPRRASSSTRSGATTPARACTGSRSLPRSTADQQAGDRLARVGAALATAALIGYPDRWPADP